MHEPRDFAKSRFKKVIGVTEDHYLFIEKLRKKKSRAGMLEEMIEFYRKSEDPSRKTKKGQS
jgi:hypothetical protein